MHTFSRTLLRSTLFLIMPISLGFSVPLSLQTVTALQAFKNASSETEQCVEDSNLSDRLQADLDEKSTQARKSAAHALLEIMVLPLSARHQNKA